MNGAGKKKPALAFSPSIARRQFWFRLSLLGVLALGIRLLHVRIVLATLGTAQIQDAAYYHDVALVMLGHLAAPELLDTVAFANVGYPYVLKWIYTLSATPTSVLLFQAGVGASTAVLTGAAARELFGSRQVGLWAAGLSALYAPSIFYDALLLIPSLSACLSALLAWSLGRAIRLRSWQWAVLSGVAIGAAALLRASQLLLLVFALISVWQHSTYPSPDARGRWAHRRLWLALLLASATCIAPVVIQQRTAAGVWAPWTANGGVNFWIGNHRGASGTYTDAPFLGASKGGDFRHTLVVERDRFLAEAQRRSNDPELTLAAADRFWFYETLREMAAAPRAWLGVVGRKLWLTVNNYEPRTNASFDLLEEISPVLRWNPFRFGVLSILAALGVTQLRQSRHPRARWILAPLVAVPALTCIAFFVSGEYRHPSSPALIAFAAFGLFRVRQAAASSAPSKSFARWPGCLFVLVTAVFALTPSPHIGAGKDRKSYAEALAMPNSDGSPPTSERYALARALLARHGHSPEDRLLATEAALLVESNQAIQFRDREAAQRLIEIAQSLWQQDLEPSATLDAPTIERIRRNSVRRIAQLCRQHFVQQWADIEPTFALLGCHSWGEANLLLSRKLLPEAQSFLDKALALAPTSVEVLAYRGQLELMRGNDPTPWLERSLAGYPKAALPALLTAEYALARGKPGDAIGVLQKAVRERPYDEALRYELGRLMLDHAAPGQTVEFFSSEAARDEKPQTSHYFMAMGFQKLGNDQAASAEFRRALEIDPAHELSQHQWGLMLERQGELVPALEHFVEATRIHPEYRPALEDVARLAARFGRHAEAVQWRERALRANPNTPRRFLYWARYLHEHARDSAALTEVTRRLDDVPQDAEAIELRRRIRKVLGMNGPVGPAR